MAYTPPTWRQEETEGPMEKWTIRSDDGRVSEKRMLRTDDGRLFVARKDGPRWRSDGTTMTVPWDVIELDAEGQYVRGGECGSLDDVKRLIAQWDAEWQAWIRWHGPNS